MKYIRTDDNIYKISKILKNGNILIKGKFHIDKNLANHFKQADTIEELCDEFVLEDETLPPHLKKDLKELCRYKIYIAGSRGVIYGAIWTDKGLIYVAKMNNEGTLELI